MDINEIKRRANVGSWAGSIMKDSPVIREHDLVNIRIEIDDMARTLVGTNDLLNSAIRELGEVSQLLMFAKAQVRSGPMLQALERAGTAGIFARDVTDSALYNINGVIGDIKRRMEYIRIIRELMK